jgi:hypothetical protein
MSRYPFELEPPELLELPQPSATVVRSNTIADTVIPRAISHLSAVDRPPNLGL